MYLFGGSCQACPKNQAVLWNDHVKYYSTCLGGKIKKKKENRQFSSFFLEWGCQAMNKALRCPAWSCAPHTSCTGPVWLAPASRDGTLRHRAARQTPSHSSKECSSLAGGTPWQWGWPRSSLNGLCHTSPPQYHPDGWRMLG